MLTNEHLAYWKIYTKGRKDAVDYAEAHCTRYLHFQACWNAIATFSWQNEAMMHVLRGEGMLNAAIAMRMAERNGGTPFAVAPNDTGFDDSNEDEPVAFAHVLRGEGMLNAAIAMRMAERNGGTPFAVAPNDTGFDDSNEDEPVAFAAEEVSVAEDNQPYYQG